MTSAGLLSLQQAITLNNLTPSQQAALLQALSGVLPIFRGPDERSAVPADETAEVADQWASALYALDAEGAQAVVPQLPLIGSPGTPPYNPTWFALTDVYIDPVSGDDTKDGATALTAIKTFAEAARRYGSEGLTMQMPSGQKTTIHLLSDQTPGVDGFYVKPQLLFGAELIITPKNPQRGANFSPTTVTAAVKDHTGTLLSLNGNLPAGTAKDDIVVNVTKGSSATIVSVTGGNATMTQPFDNVTPQAFAILTQDNTWANTDTYQVFRPLFCNCQSLSCMQSTVDDTANFGVCWLEKVHVPDASGGNGIFLLHPDAGGNGVCYLCTFEQVAEAVGLDANVIGYYQCAATTTGGSAGLVFLDGAAVWVGGYCNVLTSIGSENVVDGDAIILGGLTGGLQVTAGVCVVNGAALQGATNQVFSGAWVRNGGSGSLRASGVCWGSGTLDVDSGAHWENANHDTWQNTLKVATLQIDGQTIATPVPVKGTFVANGATQVNVAPGAGDHFPANATISFALSVSGGTPAGVFFSAAQTADNFHVNSVALNTSTYDWEASGGTDTLSAANLDKYRTMLSRFSLGGYVLATGGP